MTLEEIPKPNIFNERADFLRYTVGVNAIPFNTKTNTCPLKTWKEFQYRAVTEDEHNEWKRNKMFDNGIAIMLGKIWHRKGFENYFIFAIDCDNQLATDEIVTV